MCTSASSCVLTIISILFLICGSAFIGFGTWFLIDKDRVVNMFRISEDIEDVDVLEQPSFLEISIIIMLAYGLCLYFVSIIGIAAAFTTRVTACFFTYISVLSIAVILQVVAIALVAVYNTMFEKNAEKFWTATLKSVYIGPYDRQETASKVWDSTQAWIGCCGVHGQKDFKHHNGWDRSWVDPKTSRKTTANLPVTCCRMKSSAPDITALITPQAFADHLVRSDCPVSKLKSSRENIPSLLYQTPNRHCQ
ncbi:tetraspanin-1-like isoform X2 [Gigantopelta aegis]|uniref:tetraspanin-1-like isoform X2 n=1 Tax=Gigantopelta aegis TaxID=1735272 RepID=UPI001B88A1ED|nr:tetraspanin-1-like isoform X2 [Gigantopelta aegis]